MSPSDGSVHAGHRERVRQKILQNGIGSLQSHEILEFLLFYAIPKRDVNPLAHHLINAFGSLEAVLFAEREELLKINGVGDHTVDFLHSFATLLKDYMDAPQTDQLKIGTVTNAVEEAMRMFDQPNRQEMAVLCMDMGGMLICGDVLEWDAMTPERTRRIMEIILDSRAHCVAFVWKRLGAPRRLNKVELKDVSELLFLLTSAEVYIVDFLLLYDRKFSSLRQEGILRDRESGTGHADRMRWMEPIGLGLFEYEDGFFTIKTLDEPDATR